MSRFATGQQAVDKAEAASSKNKGGDFDYWSLKDDETDILRFLTGMDNMFVYQHECGLANWEIGEKASESARNSGSLVCPNCSKPLNQNLTTAGGDLLGIRPGVMSAPQHEYVACSDGTRRSFVCLEGAEYDGVTYECPVCKLLNDKGEKAYPVRQKIYGAAIVRRVVTEDVFANGVNSPRVVGVEDVMVEVVDEETGEKTIRPDVRLLRQGVGNFWNTLSSVHAQLQQQGGGGISWFDWYVTRHGEKLDTKFQFDKVDSTPNPLPFLEYEPYFIDLENFCENLGSPAFYHKHGFVVEGYVPPAEDEPQTAQQSMGAAAVEPPVAVAAPVAPVTPQPQPVAATAAPATTPSQTFADLQAGLKKYA